MERCDVTLGNASVLSHVLVRLGSSTHSIDSDQRRVPLRVASTSGITVTLSIPSDNGIVPPGFYYYFAVASSGVHSRGMTVNVSRDDGLVIEGHRKISECYANI